jgi:sterol desaturase/sphingolipid hydroxylase (fatty acid hydroxylase superfamily)
MRQHWSCDEDGWKTMGSVGASLVALAACVVAASQRLDVAVGFVILGAVFIVLERLLPVRRRQPLRRSGQGTDIVHAVADEFIAAPIAAAFLAVGLAAAHAFVPRALPAAVSGQHPWIQWIEAVVLAEICGYWGHRWSHELPWLWRFHKLHHSIETMDWLAPNRRHPVDLVVARVVIALPLLALGFSVPTLAAPFVVRRFQGLLVHADIRLEGGPLRWLVATPHFHHWHHAADAEGWNRNYAGQWPLVDRLFGTLVLPPHRWPTAYGLGTSEQAPQGWLAQLCWPLTAVDAASNQELHRRADRIGPATSPAVASAGTPDSGGHDSDL